jgi:hypothetical protein
VDLIEEISRNLREEEVFGTYFVPEAEYPVFTPINQEKAAGQLQDCLLSRVRGEFRKRPAVKEP